VIFDPCSIPVPRRRWASPWWWHSCGVGTKAGCCYDGVWPLCSMPTSFTTAPATFQGSRYVLHVCLHLWVSALTSCRETHPFSLYPTQQEALGRRSVGSSVAALLKPLFTDLEPATRQLTAIGRATLAQLDTVPGVGEKVRSTLRLLGFLEDEQGATEESPQGSGDRK
jgi:hypothetical protein